MEEQLIRSIYEDNAEAMADELQKHPTLIDQYFHGLGLIHHIAAADSVACLNAFLKIGGNMSQRTTSFVFNFSACPLFTVGGQTALHVALDHKSNEIAALLPLWMMFAIDDLGFTPNVYKTRANDVEFVKECRHRLVAANVNRQLRVPAHDELHVQNLNDYSEQTKALQQEFMSMYNTLSEQDTPPNSMHKAGTSFQKSDRGFETIVALAERLLASAGLPNNLTDHTIYAFTAEYSAAKDVKLDTHVDNSMITINWCFHRSIDLLGTELVFDDDGTVIKQLKDQTIIHHGKRPHHVMPMKAGTRKNLIIWVR